MTEHAVKVPISNKIGIIQSDQDEQRRLTGQVIRQNNQLLAMMSVMQQRLDQEKRQQATNDSNRIQVQSPAHFRDDFIDKPT